jgi:hypothetical protein
MKLFDMSCHNPIVQRSIKKLPRLQESFSLSEWIGSDFLLLTDVTQARYLHYGEHGVHTPATCPAQTDRAECTGDARGDFQRFFSVFSMRSVVKLCKIS